MAGAAGFEPTTYGLEDRCSILLSYAPAEGLRARCANSDFTVRIRRPAARGKSGHPRRTESARLTYRKDGSGRSVLVTYEIDTKPGLA